MQAYNHLLSLFSEHLNAYSTSLNSLHPKELYQPGNYILSLGGKRVRPLLALIACDLLDKNPELALPSALSVELFHNFSLIHDDILDNAPKRRNKATVHEKWSTNIAILAGDILLVKALQVLESPSVKTHHDLVKIFLKTSAEVCEGQQLDMNFETLKKVSVDDYLHMITLKTAVLLGCSLQMGAIAAGAGIKTQQHLFEFGKHLGIAFQLLDDYLDVFAEKKEQFGKQIGGDIISNKKTFLLLKAIELADAKGKQKIVKALNLKQNNQQKIKVIKGIYKELGVAELCLAEADKHTQLALSYLDKIKAATLKKEHLKQFALQLLYRTK